MSRFSKRLFFVNLLGTLFYLGCLLQWTWAALPYMPGIIRIIEALQGPANVAKPVQQVAITEPPSLTLLIIAIAVTILVIGLTLYALVKLPLAVAKSGQKVTQKASAHIVPVITHHAKLTPKKQRRLTAHVIVYLKLTICVAPIILSGLAYFLETSLAYGIIMIVAAILGINSLALLGGQLLFTKWLKVKSEAVW